MPYIVTPDGEQSELPAGTKVYLEQPHWSDKPGRNAARMNDYAFIIWLVILGILGITLFLFGFLAYKSRDDAATAAFLMAPATTALGAIAGLLAPSPASGGDNGSRNGMA